MTNNIVFQHFKNLMVNFCVPCMRNTIRGAFDWLGFICNNAMLHIFHKGGWFFGFGAKISPYFEIKHEILSFSSCERFSPYTRSLTTLMESS